MTLATELILIDKKQGTTMANKIALFNKTDLDIPLYKH